MKILYVFLIFQVLSQSYDIYYPGIKCNTDITCQRYGSNAGLCQNSKCICSREYFGIFCEQRKDIGLQCSNEIRCQNKGVCNPDTKICECNENFTGAFCELPKTRNCTSNEGCSNGLCDLQRGVCRCSTGFYGERCEIHVSNGAKCNDDKDCKHGGKCMIESKHCLCKPQWSGIFCEFPNGDYHCNSNTDCSTCNTATGKCRCSMSSFGRKCEFQNEGYRCQEGSCKNGGICSKESETCICQEGYHGNNCEMKSGFKCISTGDCNHHYCDTSTGKCVCRVTHYGLNCELNKQHGFTCKDSGMCKNNGTCVENHCQCSVGYSGSYCEIKNHGYFCNADSDCRLVFGSSDQGYCNKYTKQCICSTYYSGIACEVPESFGKRCQPGQCKNGGFCSEESKKCICSKGWTGNYCEIQSNFECMSARDCNYYNSKNGVCNYATKKCICSSLYTSDRCQHSFLT